MSVGDSQNPLEQEDKRSTSELVNIILGLDPDSDEAWDLIGTIRHRGTVEEFTEGERLCAGKNPKERRLGADILAQLGWGGKKFQEESVEILIPLLKDEDDSVIASAAFALGHRQSEEAVPELLKLVHHENPEVRFGVAFGLCQADDERAIDGLIELSDDSDYDTKNWAVFGLGSICEFDNEKIRTALLNKLIDNSPEIRGEALIGLANRDVPYLKPYLIKELKELAGDYHGNWAIRAAEITKDPRYHHLLIDILQNLPHDTGPHHIRAINDAIAACSDKEK